MSEVMDQIIIACQTLRDELLFALKKTGFLATVLWIESGLHNSPAKLHERLQETLDGITGCTRVLLLFGFCGNAVLGLKTGSYELILPRADDCISILFGSNGERKEFEQKNSAYFLTEGWLRGERNLWIEYLHALDKYGEKQAEEIVKIMFGHYKSLALLNTGVNQIEELLVKTKVIAETFNLKQIIAQGTTLYIETLLRGPWVKKYFVSISPNSVINDADLLSR